MREIKFRAWYSGYMYSAVSRMDFCRSGFLRCQLNEDDFNYNTCGDTWADEGEDVVIMQYTGMKDCYGKEIYEGDVVEYDVSDFSPATLKVAEWLDNEHCYNFGASPGSLRVMGNIYDNPELIKGGSRD